MKFTGYGLLILLLIVSCSLIENNSFNKRQLNILEYGGDFSIMKKMEDAGGLYKVNGVVKEGYEIFKENGYTWARLRVFHSPDGTGPVCNDLAYTIASAKKAKSFGFKILLNFHYSDTWADPGHQTIPAAWKDLPFEVVRDSLYNYTKEVVDAMELAGSPPDMVQIGNEIDNGFLWPHGKLWFEPGPPNWDDLSTLLKAGIRGVKDAENGDEIKIMIHAANGGNVNSSYNFYKNILERDVDFDVIGMSYYPWWHGTFVELEANLLFLSSKFRQSFSIVETAYYANGWYPELTELTSNRQPYPPTEQGQNDYLLNLAAVIKKHPRVKTIFYWKPDGLDFPKTKVNYLGRSLFDENGDALQGISAWKRLE